MEVKDIHTNLQIFQYLGFPCVFGKDGLFVEEVQLVVTDTGYINYPDTESIFYKKKYPLEEKFSFGDIIVEFSNSGRDARKIISLFEFFRTKYTYPTIDFAKEFYRAFRDIGYSDLVTRCIVFGALYQLCLCKTLQNFEYKEYFYLWVFINPVNIISQTKYLHEGFAKVYFEEDPDGNPLLVYTGFENYTLQVFDSIHARKHNITIRECSYCNGFFVERNGNNIKYCSKCGAIQSDLKADVFQKAYRRAYKTMLQRQKRYGNKCNKDENDYFKKYTEVWITAAKKQLQLYKKNNDIIGFEKYLKESTQAYKPQKRK